MRGGIAVNFDSSLIAVSSSDTNTVKIYTIDGTGGIQVTGTPVTYSSLSTKTTTGSPFHCFVSFVRRGSVDTLLIVDAGNLRIVEISVTGTLIRNIAVTVQPDAVSYSRGVILVSAYAASTVTKLDYVAASLIQTIVISTVANNAFGTRTSKDGLYFFVAEYANNVVSKWDLNTGVKVSEVATQVANSISNPSDILECDDGSLIIVSIGTNTLVVVNSAGVTTGTVGSTGSSPGQLNVPFSLAYSSKHGVLVKEILSGGRVQGIPASSGP